MDLGLIESDIREWFAGYLSAFTALGRGTSTPAEVAEYFFVPLLVTTDDVVISLRSSDDVASWLTVQADGMAAAGYDHTHVSSTDVRVANGTTATVRALMVRRRKDGSDISELSVTYVLVRDQRDLRVHALLVHSA
ncbi:DUF6841 family protein [Nocardioides pinisoli]|uniref:DUF6841 domain-containing protein n=1 Tax=Nocardioides pinisoli TaxID=2950279 RepID=A0ABT1L5E7_9ACTN|nr:hypothetical protein [Nocardioides pinisoli]MCP3424446.1 hypothetical protein [Nocardioides pinisoli]